MTMSELSNNKILVRSKYW